MRAEETLAKGVQRTRPDVAVDNPEGRQREAELLAEDLEIESVRPARAGMSTSELTVLLVYSP